MFLNKLQLISPLFHRNYVAYKATEKLFCPSLKIQRTYSRIIQDDDDDRPIVQTSINQEPIKTKKKLFQSSKTKSGKKKRAGRYTFQSFTEDLMRLKPIEWSSKALNVIEKSFHRPCDITKNRSENEIREFQKKHEISVGQCATKPIFKFDELNILPQTTMDVIREHGFSECTPIQAQGIPIALSGKNMIGIAQTGSGKTLAYVLPAIMHIFHQKSSKQGDGPVALILAPTRELAQQIQQVLLQFGGPSGIKSLCLCGGVGKIYQMADINKGFDIAIATPGRLIDLLDGKTLDLHRCSYLVLDEADRMLDMGFEPQIRQILSQIPPNRQILMWSATWPNEVRELANDFIDRTNFEHLTVGTTDLCANRNIKQNVIVCEGSEKPHHLLKILESMNDLSEDDRKTLIFVRTRRAADEVTRSLKSRGFQAESIHGGFFQTERENVITKYKNGDIQILVATNVASRGLDINNIKHVINFDYPETTNDYVHRIGRTGRCNSTGTAYTLFTENDFIHAADLVGVLRDTEQEIPSQLFEFAEIRRVKKQ